MKVTILTTAHPLGYATWWRGNAEWKHVTPPEQKRRDVSDPPCDEKRARTSARSMPARTAQVDAPCAERGCPYRAAYLSGGRALCRHHARMAESPQFFRSAPLEWMQERRGVRVQPWHAFLPGSRRRLGHLPPSE